MLSGTKAEAQTVLGKLTNVPKNTRIGVAKVVGNKTVPVDTLELDNFRRFKLQTACDKPTLFLLAFSSINQSTIHLMLSPNDMVSIELDYDINSGFMKVVSASGSRDVELYRHFNNTLSNFASQVQPIENEFKRPNTSEARKQELSNRYMQLQTAQNDTIRKILYANADAVMSAFLVTYFDNNAEDFIDVYDTIYNALKDKYADNQFVQYVASKVKASLGPGRPAPDIIMNDPAGKERRLSDLRGKVVLIDFWASWCRPCRMENPNVVRLFNKYHDKGFEIFSVSLDRKHEDWVRAIRQDGLVWENHVSDLNGWTSSGGATYGITSVPSTVLVGADGKIIARNLRGDALAKKLEDLFGSGNGD